MGQSLATVYVHFIFSTKNRRPLIHPDVASDLYSYLSGVCKNLECPSLAISGTADHVHILCRLSRSITIAKFIEEIKSTSSRWIKGKGREYMDFQWQAGYGALSIGQSGVNALMKYIAEQEEHHKKTSFQEEYRAFLRKYKIDYDEDYLWE